MRLLVFIILFFVSQNSLLAHDPLSSFFQLEIYENSCLLSINLSQYGSEQAIIKKDPNLNLETIDPDEYKKLLIDYIKENTLIEIDGLPLKIGKGAIKLGSHQTDLKFELLGTSSRPKNLKVTIDCFSENEKHANFFRLKYKGMKKRVKLSAKNNFQSNLTITENEILPDENSEEEFSNSKLLWIFGGILIITMLLFLVNKLRKTSPN